MYCDSIGHRLKTINNLVKRNVDKMIGHKPDKATLMHAWIMAFLTRREKDGLDTFQKDIEKEFSMNRSTTSEMLKLMANHGMIERIVVGRSKKIVLTSLGKECHHKNELMISSIHNLLMDGFDDDEIALLSQYCDRMIENLKRGLYSGKPDFCSFL